MPYQQYAALIYSIAYSYMQNREDAEDMTGEAFVRLFEHGTDFRRRHRHGPGL
ncbi:MAG: hypothetical protein IKQ39_05425 [Oscillospiraceae bacterium]|nr:hypothetical protein [Oscillospiraceae bacterium]